VDTDKEHLQWPHEPAILLGTGREIQLESLLIHRTYYGVLAGDPRRVSEMIRDGLKRDMRRSNADAQNPHYAIDDGRPVLPAYSCTAELHSDPADPSYDLSVLTLHWFTNEIDLPVSEFVKAALDQVIWEKLAKDGLF